jgi:hypothetical protein
MAISGDYSSPVQVNGFACRNCTDVANAKKHIDPAHPKSGPYGVNAATDPSRQNSIILDGVLRGMEGRGSSTPAPGGPSTGRQLDLMA